MKLENEPKSVGVRHFEGEQHRAFVHIESYIGEVELQTSSVGGGGGGGETG